MGKSSEFVLEGKPVRVRPAFASLTTVALLSIILVNVLGSLYWVQRNVLLYGNDASGYLGTTLDYTRFFDDLSPTTLFTAFTYPQYRTPALFIATQPFYWLFGVDMDSAQLVNVVTLAALIWICYELGRYAGGRGVGLMSALLVGLLPMVMAMARLFYTELPLAALVALNLLALAKSEDFRRRGWSIAWGVSLGIGMLVKWALPIYTLLPTLWVLWRAGLFSASLESLRHLRVDRRALLIASGVSLAGTLIWCLPNLGQLDGFLLGNWLIVAWFVAGVLWVYALQRPGAAVGNLWTGVITAVVLASPWYFPYIDFAARLVTAEQERGDAGATPLHLYNYVRYFRFFYRFHLGALATWIIIPAALFPWLRALWRRKPIQANSALLWLSLLSTYLILLLLSQSSPRFVVPALPALAVLLAISLSQYSRPARIVIGAAWIGVLALQWSLFTFDALQPVYARTEPLWTWRSYSIQPRSYETDLSYWIGPDVLERMVADGELEDQELGMLANSPQLHRGILRYLIAIDDLPVDIRTLTENDSPGWSGLLASQWVLVEEGDNKDVEPPGQVLIQRILDGDPLFHRLYREVTRYPFPDGRFAYLYHRAEGPGHPYAMPERLAQTRGVADVVRQAWSPHASLLYANPNMAVWVGIHDLPTERMAVLDGDARVNPEQLAAQEDTLLVVWPYRSHNLSAWMEQNAYRAGEIGDESAAVAIFGRPREAPVPLDAAAAWPAVELTSLRTHPTVAPGQVLPIEVEFASADGQDLKISVRLMGQDGAVIASNDRVLAPADRLGLFVPPATAPGAYTLAAIVYDPATMEVVADKDGASPSILTEIHVAE